MRFREMTLTSPTKADDAFALRSVLMKQFSGYNMDHDERVFNYRLSRAEFKEWSKMILVPWPTVSSKQPQTKTKKCRINQSHFPAFVYTISLGYGTHEIKMMFWNKKMRTTNLNLVLPGEMNLPYSDYLLNL